MGAKHFATIFLLALCTIAWAKADSVSTLGGSCLTLCQARDWPNAEKCFVNERGKADGYLAVAHCALRISEDSIAEQYALKSAVARSEWITFFNRLGIVDIKTGGLGETYVAAWVASGGARHKTKAIGFLRTSGQCRSSPDPDLCAHMYFNSSATQLMTRTVMWARDSGLVGKALSGRITDHFDKPIKYAKVTFKCNAKDHIGQTDANGRYSFPFDPTMTAADACREGRLYVKLEYTDPKDNITYIRVRYGTKPVWAMKFWTFRSEADLVQDFKLANGLAAPNYFGDPDVQYIGDFSVMYTHTVEALEYYKDVLKAKVDYLLPVDVFGYFAGTSTLYTPTTSSIQIIGADSQVTSSDRPRNREYHEFSHHVMYTLYNGWPAPPAGATPAEENHAGYSNPTTSDSYVEGFAEYMALVISDHYRQPNPDVYASFGSMEKNWKPWADRGLAEEFAIAGILWDLYDSGGDERVDLEPLQVWNVIKNRRENFGEVYDDFIAKFPGFKKDIDHLFVRHGFWVDTTPGDGAYEAVEAFRDANGNNRWNAPEFYVDYAREEGTNLSFMIHQDTEKIGYATNYQRLTRKSAVRVPGRYLKVDNTVPTYKVSVSFPDNPSFNYENLADNKGGFVYVTVPPSDEGNAVVTVTPEGVVTTKLFTITSQEFEAVFADAWERGYFAEHDFQVSSPAAAAGLPALGGDPGKPYWEEKDLVPKPEDFVYRAPADEPLPVVGPSSIASLAAGGSLAQLPWLLIAGGVVALILVVAAVLLLKRKGKKR
ncbi:MAG: carboxypeptidase-like regulatory domain-containing protein [Nanoarchaeota archaeon]